MFCSNFCLVLFWFLFVLSLYIEIFYYEICLEVEKMVEKMWETSRKIEFLEHNQTLEIFSKAFFGMQQNTWKYFPFPKIAFPENILHEPNIAISAIQLCKLRLTITRTRSNFKKKKITKTKGKSKWNHQTNLCLFSLIW